VLSGLAVFFALNSIHYEAGEEEEREDNWTASWRENSGPINGGQALRLPSSESLHASPLTDK
jgi:hypothetical protein